MNRGWWKALIVMALVLAGCGYVPPPAVVVTVVVTATAVPPTAKPYVAPERLTAYEWSQAASPYVEGIYNELMAVQGYTDRMANNTYLDLSDEFAQSFDRIAENCRGLDGLKPPLEYASAHDELLAACPDFLQSGDAIADFFRTGDAYYLDEALSWILKANTHVANAAGALGGGS